MVDVRRCSSLSLLVTLACLDSASSYSYAVHGSHRGITRIKPACCHVRLSETGSNRDDDSLPSYEFNDISREIAKYDSAGLRFRQSGPVRYVTSGVASIFGEAGALARFMGGAVSVVPFYGMMMVLLLLAFGLQSSAPRAAMVAGARMNGAILRGGQYHRLISACFLHGGGMHLASNMFSLYRVGPLVEAAFGAGRAALLYLLSGIGGNLAGLYWGPIRGMSVGASGAVFGMIGATGGYVVRNKRALGGYGDALLRNAVQILALNLFIGTRRGSGVDNLAHVGGFITGAVLGVLFSPAVESRGRGRWDDDAPAPREGDGSFVPAWAVRALLAATVVAYAAGLREAGRIAQAVQRVYGR